MSCKHDFWEMQGFKPTCSICGKTKENIIEAQLKAANARIAELETSRIVTCVYCGHEYPKGTPSSQNSLLTEHIKVCEKHPMRLAEKQLELTRQQRDAIFEKLEQAEAQNKRMREALEMARPALVRADSDTSYIAHRYSHVLTAAKCPLTEAELLKTSGMCRAAEKAVKAALDVNP